MTSDADLQPTVAAEFQALADLLDSATATQWNTPALNHVVIHGLDATVPLGVPRRSPDDIIRIVLDDLTQGGVLQHFGTSIEGRRLQATDLDWSYGSGPALSGKAEDLALVLCGRTVPAGRLTGYPL